MSKLIDTIESIVQQNGFEFYDSELVTENDRLYFRVYIIKEGGVTLDDCSKISRIISPILDVDEPTSSEYIFEVSSPGVERKLTKQKHFMNSIGENVKIKTTLKEKYMGFIKSADSSGIVINVENKDVVINYGDILSAKTYFVW